MQNLNNQVESVERFDSFMRKDARIVDESIPTEYEESRSYRVLYRCAFSLSPLSGCAFSHKIPHGRPRKA